jgi:hypothetical protein
MQRRLENA